jgi:predicted ATPase
MYRPNIPLEQVILEIGKAGKIPTDYASIPKSIRVPQVYDVSRVPTNFTDSAELYETIRQHPYSGFYLVGEANSGKTTAAVKAGRRDLSIGNGIFIPYHNIPPFETWMQEQREWWDTLHSLLESEDIYNWSAQDFFSSARPNNDGLDVFLKKVIITDVDPTPGTWSNERRRGFGKIMEWCYNYGRPLILTSTREIETLYVDKYLDQHVVSQLLESSIILQTPSKSYIKNPLEGTL